MGWARDNGVKALCFDIDGTFYPKWQTNLYLLRSALPHPVFSMRYNSMRQRMRQADGLPARPGMDLDGFREREMILLGWTGGIDAYKECYEKRLAAPWRRAMGFIKPFNGLKDALVKAKDQGYVLACLSDFPLDDKLSILGLDGIFDWTSSTEDLGALKPNARPFLSMLDALGLEAGQCLYTGDSYRKDIVGGAAIGMRTAWIHPRAKAEGHPLADLVLTSWPSFANIVLD